MAIDPVKIPQNVYIEDRVVGPLTLRQTLIITVGCGLSYAVYASLSKAGPVSIPVTIMVWIPGALSVLFALIKVNDLSLSRIFLLMLERAQKPARRVWAPRPGISINIRFSSAQKTLGEQQAQVQQKQQQETKAQQKIRELSAVVDTSLPVENGTPAAMDDVTPLSELSPETEVLDAEMPQEKPEPFPVDPKRIKTDGGTYTPGFSDLSVFRDIFPNPPNQNG